MKHNFGNYQIPLTLSYQLFIVFITGQHFIIIQFIFVRKKNHFCDSLLITLVLFIFWQPYINNPLPILNYQTIASHDNPSLWHDLQHKVLQRGFWQNFFKLILRQFSQASEQHSERKNTPNNKIITSKHSNSDHGYPPLKSGIHKRE